MMMMMVMVMTLTTRTFQSTNQWTMNRQKKKRDHDIFGLFPIAIYIYACQAYTHRVQRSGGVYTYNFIFFFPVAIYIYACRSYTQSVQRSDVVYT